MANITTERPQARSGKDLAQWLDDLMSRCEDGPNAWDAADKISFARSVTDLLIGRAADEADQYFVKHLPGYAADQACDHESTRG